MKKRISIFSLLVTQLFFQAAYGYSHSNIDDSRSIYADVLYWKVTDAVSDNWAQVITPEARERGVQIQKVPFKWSPGLRIGLTDLLTECWDYNLFYTFYRTKGATNATALSGGVYSPFLGNFFINNTLGFLLSGPTYRSANVEWKVLYNIADLEIGYTLPLASCLKLRPFLGLKGGAINHTIHTNWYNPTVATTFTAASENIKNNFWGLGPSIGLHSTWTVYQMPTSAFNIIAQASGALFWGHWKFKDQYQNNTPASVDINIDPVAGGATMARGFLGVEWVGCLQETDFSIRLGYEAQVWFKQLQFYSFNMGRLNNHMSLQGALLGIQFKF